MSKQNNGKGLPYLKEWTCAMVQDPRVKQGAVKAAAVLREHADTRSATVYLGFNTLGALTGVSGETAKKHRRLLRNLGWLTDTGETVVVEGYVLHKFALTIPDGYVYVPPGRGERGPVSTPPVGVGRGPLSTPRQTHQGGPEDPPGGSESDAEGLTPDPHTAEIIQPRLYSRGS